MDNQDLRLYHEEQLHELRKLHEAVAGLRDIFSGKVDVSAHVEVPDEVTISNPVNSVEVNNLDNIKQWLDGLGEVVAKAIAEHKPETLEAVRVINMKEAQPQQVKIGNLSDLKTYFDRLQRAISENQPILNITKQEIVFPRSAREAIPVRLSDGKSFYEAIASVVAGATGNDKVFSAKSSGSVTVGSSSTTVLAANSRRHEAIIVNDSDEAIYIKYGEDASLNSGIRLNASGGSIVEETYTGIITAICASGNKVLTVTEV